MTGSECQQVYQELVTLLQDLQFGWVVEQVEAQLQATTLVEMETWEQPAQVESNTPQAVLVKPITGGVQERLLLLVDAVERMIVDSIEIEGALVDFLAEETHRLHAPVSIEFESDPLALLASTDQGLEERRPAIAELRQLLQELRQEALAGVH
ncbi:hypothetical protein ACQ4M3_41460 [Leptolyngbya sp. AN03gr2]|uniref:hypothetical protein n=1 Tax=unclassified Leptolyngbya TaxID=2650499 RepID=UPI003D310B19